MYVFFIFLLFSVIMNPINWLNDWLTDWLIGWLITYFIFLESKHAFHFFTFSPSSTLAQILILTVIHRKATIHREPTWGRGLRAAGKERRERENCRRCLADCYCVGGDDTTRPQVHAFIRLFCSDEQQLCKRDPRRRTGGGGGTGGGSPKISYVNWRHVCVCVCVCGGHPGPRGWSRCQSYRKRWSAVSLSCCCCCC